MTIADVVSAAPIEPKFEINKQPIGMLHRLQSTSVFLTNFSSLVINKNVPAGPHKEFTICPRVSTINNADPWAYASPNSAKTFSENSIRVSVGPPDAIEVKKVDFIRSLLSSCDLLVEYASANFGAITLFIAVSTMLVAIDTLLAALYIPTSLLFARAPSISVGAHTMIIFDALIRRKSNAGDRDFAIKL